MTLIEKLIVICGVSVILFPFTVVVIVHTLDAIYSYFNDRWVNEGNKGKEK